MSDKAKKVFLLLTIIVPFLLYCVYYYGRMLKNAPYKFTEFKSFVFKYGDGDSLVNTYNSLTGEYQYLNKKDSLVKTNLLLTKDDLLYLHRKAADLGFWDFPSKELNSDTTGFHGRKAPHYYIEFNYERKSKKVLFDASFNGDDRLKDANVNLIKEIMHVLADAEDRKKK
ncbi:hypothetical protein JN11_03269 [Mucilaginibacter frigoritolerans]|jgi:hypothetical protein|uniref:Uncharacterized protein n=1 Tax=Mucilaginibacter frigoritolerans TaxID=652788 RepID=A0A562TZD3_9SPHI|nr:hypothetical protein [Mucilaginibacter frigoritolerans]TWI98190.1 hypothetical protein JN11_03269 [Mucilaginibacter frigoritolerans]